MDANGAQYQVQTTDQLSTLCKYSKSKDLGRFVDVWAATLRRDGKCLWDNAFFVAFNVKPDRKREAIVYRRLPNGEEVFCAELKYNQALRFCKEVLKEVTI